MNTKTTPITTTHEFLSDAEWPRAYYRVQRRVLRCTVKKAMRFIEEHFKSVDAYHLAAEVFGAGNIREHACAEFTECKVLCTTTSWRGRRLEFWHPPMENFRPTREQLFWGVASFVLDVQSGDGPYVPYFCDLNDRTSVGRHRREMERAIVDALVEREARARATMAVHQ